MPAKVIGPSLEFVFELRAKLGPAIDIGPTPYGFRRMIEIVAGAFDGPLLSGKLLPGGADWQIVRSDGVIELHAHYILATVDGTLIQVKVRGLRHAAGDALVRIAAGEIVASTEYYFAIAPIFEAPSGPYEWLNRSVFVGSGERQQQAVTLRFFRVT